MLSIMHYMFTFTNTQVFNAAPKQAVNHIHMANAVINQDTGASLEYHQLIQDAGPCCFNFIQNRNRICYNVGR
jgi:hypothetical protein